MTTPLFVTSTEYRSAAFWGSLSHCNTSPIAGSHNYISLYMCIMVTLNARVPLQYVLPFPILCFKNFHCLEIYSSWLALKIKKIMLDLQYIFNAAYHKASQSNQSWQETVCSSAEGNGEVSTVSDLGWYPLPPCQLGATQRLGKYTMHGNTTCSISTYMYQ